MDSLLLGAVIVVLLYGAAIASAVYMLSKGRK